MAKFRLTVDKRSGMGYFPKAIRMDGFVGELEGIPDALTIVLVRPGCTLSEVEKSLSLVIADIRLRLEHDGRNQR